MVRIFGLDTLSSSPLLVVFKVFSSCPGRGNRLAYGKGCRHQSRWWWKDSSPTMSLGSIPRHLFHRRPHTGLSTRTLVPLSTVSTLVPSRLCSTLTTHAVMLHPLSLLWSGVTTPRSSMGRLYFLFTLPSRKLLPNILMLGLSSLLEHSWVYRVWTDKVYCSHCRESSKVSSLCEGQDQGHPYHWVCNYWYYRVWLFQDWKHWRVSIWVLFICLFLRCWFVVSNMMGNIISSKIHYSGFISYASKPGGMSNEPHNILYLVINGTYDGIAISGDCDHITSSAMKLTLNVRYSYLEKLVTSNNIVSLRPSRRTSSRNPLLHGLSALVPRCTWQTQSLSRKISGRTFSATVCSTMLSLLRWPWPRRIPYAIDLLVSIHANFLGISLAHWLVYRCLPRRSTSWRFPWRPFLYLATASVSLDDTKTRSVSELLCTVTLPTISSSIWLMSTTLVSLEGSTYLPTITYLHGTFIGYVQQQSRFSYAIFSY